jgi:hypothetical protein
MVVNCTFSDNIVTGGKEGVGGAGTGIGKTGESGDPGAATGGAVYGRGSEVSVANSILANSRVTIGGTVTDRGGNLSTDRNPLLTSATSMKLTNPFFQPLANNGGPTPTMALLTNSPAIDRGLVEFCPPVDQRGTNRLGACDIGAYEFSGGSTNIPLPSIPTNVLSSFSFQEGTNQLVLLWPTGYTNLFLQVSTNLQSSNTVWAYLTNSVSTNGGTNSFAVSTTNSTRRRAFFRLIGITNLARTNTSTSNIPPFPPFPF